MNKDALLRSSFAANIARLNAATAAGEAVVWEQTPMVSPPPASVDTHTNTVFVELALSGRVSPAALTAPLSVTARQTVLNEVVEQCIVEADSQQVRWLLKQPKRVEVIRTLIAENQLFNELAKPLPETDLFGEQLRALLRKGANAATQQRTHNELLALMEAMEATQPLGLPQPDWTALRQQIGFHNFRADQRLLLTNGLVGRKKELAQLHTLLTESSASPTFWRGLLVRGMGGSGKSTLLAKFIDEVLASQSATLVLFDFDRPGINPNDLLGLESEMARQIGYQYPVISEQLRLERARTRKVMQLGTQQVSESSYKSENRGMLSAILEALMHRPVNNLPLLLLLDTFEEVIQLEATGRLLEWLRAVVEQFGGVPVRIIFSGRLYADDNDDERADFTPGSELGQLQAFTGQPPLTLAELTRREATQLLQKLNVPVAARKRIINLPPVARQPLTLKLLARMIAEHGDDILTDIEKDIPDDRLQAGLLFMGLVYKRALERMSRTNNGPIDALTQQLAYPGLWLRYATPDLIMKVVAPALNLTMTTNEAEQALTQLTRYKWICYRQPDGQVWHRRDLRRAMLLALRTDKPDIARLLSETTITYLNEQGLAEVNPQIQAEIMYHRLLWVLKPEDGASLNLAALKAAAEYIDTDVVDLPKPAQVLLEYARKGVVSPSKNEFLPFIYIANAYHRTGQRLVNDQQFGKALQHLLSRRAVNLSPLVEPHNSWELDTLFATASWHQLYATISTPHKWPLTIDQETYFGGYYYMNALIGSEWSSKWTLHSRLALLALIKEGDLHTDRQQYAKRLSIQGLLQCIYADQLPAQTDYWLPMWVSGVKTIPQLLSSAHFTRKLLYLELLVPGEPLSLTLAPSLLKIDPVWLDNLMTRPWMKSQAGETGKRLRQRLLDARAKLRATTVRRILDSLDALYRDRFDARVQGDIHTYIQDADELLRWFRGPDSEFRDPTRFALLDAFQTPDDYRELAQLIGDSLPIHVTDLEPEAFTNAIQPDPEHFLEPYIELVDRAWALGTLLANAAKARPDNERLKWVKAAHQRWDAAVTAAFRQWNPGIIPTRS